MSCFDQNRGRLTGQFLAANSLIYQARYNSGHIPQSAKPQHLRGIRPTGRITQVNTKRTIINIPKPPYHTRNHHESRHQQINELIPNVYNCARMYDRQAGRQADKRAAPIHDHLPPSSQAKQAPLPSLPSPLHQAQTSFCFALPPHAFPSPPSIPQQIPHAIL